MASHNPETVATSMESTPDHQWYHTEINQGNHPQTPFCIQNRYEDDSRTGSFYQPASSCPQETFNSQVNQYAQELPPQQGYSYHQEGTYQQGSTFQRETFYQSGNPFQQRAVDQHTTLYQQGNPHYQENPYWLEDPYFRSHCQEDDPYQEAHDQRFQNQKQPQGPNQLEHFARAGQRECQLDYALDEGIPESSQGPGGHMHQRQGKTRNAASGNLNCPVVEGFTQNLPIRTHSQVLLPSRPRTHEQRLPEPALTLALPKQRAAGMPSVNQQELLGLISTAEQYLAVLRLNQPAQNLQSARPLTAPAPEPFPSRLSDDNHINHQKDVDTSVSSLPGLAPSGNSQFENSQRLPGITKQLLFEAEAKKKAYKKKLRTSQVHAPHGAQVINTRTPPEYGSQPIARMSAIRGIPGVQGRVFKSTPRTVKPHRLKLRGPSNGYCSFGDLAQVDMPTSSLEHFSITRLSRTANEHYVRPRDYHQPELRFNIFQEFLKRPELVITLAGHLRVQELLILYRICKPFHSIVNQRFTTVVLSQAVRRAPESSRIFPFRCYSKLCIDDPGERPHPIAQRAAAGQHRKVPSFRWLLMVCFREMVSHEIRIIMAEDGTPLPEQCESVLKKIWFMMDIPDSLRRIGVVQNSDVFTDFDLFFATLLFVKMDMRFTDPVTGSGRDGMRRLLLSQPSLSTFWKALRRSALVNKMDAVKMFIRWKWQPPARLAGQTVFGIPPDEIGTLQYESWGRTGSRVRLQRPDEIILKESIRRGLGIQVHYTDMFMWGYVNPRTLQNMPPVPERRNLERLEGMEGLLIPRADRRDRSAGKPVSKMVEFH